jgi:hypothetical protein
MILKCGRNSMWSFSPDFTPHRNSVKHSGECNINVFMGHPGHQLCSKTEFKKLAFHYVFFAQRVQNCDIMMSDDNLHDFAGNLCAFTFVTLFQFALTSPTFAVLGCRLLCVMHTAMWSPATGRTCDQCHECVSFKQPSQIFSHGL